MTTARSCHISLANPTVWLCWILRHFFLSQALQELPVVENLLFPTRGYERDKLFPMGLYVRLAPYCVDKNPVRMTVSNLAYLSRSAYRPKLAERSRRCQFSTHLTSVFIRIVELFHIGIQMKMETFISSRRVFPAISKQKEHFTGSFCQAVKTRK